MFTKKSFSREMFSAKNIFRRVLGWSRGVRSGPKRVPINFRASPDQVLGRSRLGPVKSWWDSRWVLIGFVNLRVRCSKLKNNL
jgi:hypothetical protein